MKVSGKHRNVGTRRILGASLVVGLGLLVTGCDGARREVVHPTAKNIRDASELVAAIKKDGAATSVSTTDKDLKELAHRLSGSRLLYALGSVDGPRPTVFGRIADVAVDHDGSIYVLDSHYHEIRQFSPDGSYIATFGGPGSGPLEFRDPVTIAILPGGQIAVAARRGGLKIFKRTASGIELLRSIPSWTIPARDLCVLRDVLYVRGFTANSKSLIHAFDLMGRSRGSFGELYRADSWLATGQLSDGMITCVTDPPRVLDVMELLPYVRAYSVDGRLIWTSAIADFEPQKVIEFTDSDGARAIQRDHSRPADRVVQLKEVPHGHALVQILRMGARPDRSRTQPVLALDSYLLSGSTGHGVYLGNTIPWAVEVDRERIYALERAEIPTLGVYTYNPPR